MENKPEYRIRVIIEDVNVGEEVLSITGALYSFPENTLEPAFGLLRMFNQSNAKKSHEATHYPKDEE